MTRAVGRQMLLDAFPDDGRARPARTGIDSGAAPREGAGRGRDGSHLREPRKERTTRPRRSRGWRPTSEARRSSGRRCTRESSKRTMPSTACSGSPPGFFTGDETDVTEAICREARTTFGADLGMLWRVVDGRLELVCAAPWHEPLAPGTRSSARGLSDALRRGRATSRSRSSRRPGGGARRGASSGCASSASTRRSGFRSRSGARRELVLIVSWQTIISEPDPSTLVLAPALRRPGRARPRAARAATGSGRGCSPSGRDAPAAGGHRGALARRDAGATSAIPASSTRSRRSGPKQASSCSRRAGGLALELVVEHRVLRRGARSLAGVRARSDMPFTRAIAVGAPVWALTAEAMADFVGAPVSEDAGWVSLPLRTSARVHGALHLAFRQTRMLGDDERRWLETVVSQCAQALERSLLFDEEQRLRERSERLQEMTAALSNALTRADVAEVVVAGVEGAIGADGGGARDRAGRATARADDRLAGIRRRASRSAGSRHRSVSGSRARTPSSVACRISSARSTSFATRTRTSRKRRSPGTRRSSSFRSSPVAGRMGFSLPRGRNPGRSPPTSGGSSCPLAGQAALALDRARSFESEQTIAETLQRSVLPATLPRVEGVQLAARYLPGTAELSVGGDWFDAIPLRDGRIGLVVGDVVGKGVQAAATMAQLRNALAGVLDRPHEALVDARHGSTASPRRCSRPPSPRSCTRSSIRTHASAGTRQQAIRRRSSPTPTAGSSCSRADVGFRSGTGPTARYTQEVVELPAGSVLVLYTDGLVERRRRIDRRGARPAASSRSRQRRAIRSSYSSTSSRRWSATPSGTTTSRSWRRASSPSRLARSTCGCRQDRLARPRSRRAPQLARGAPAGRSEAEESFSRPGRHARTRSSMPRRAGDGIVLVRAALDDGRVRIVVEDAGGWGVLRRTGLTEASGSGSIRSLMSSVDVVAEDDGTRVTFERALRRSRRGLS